MKHLYGLLYVLSVPFLLHVRTKSGSGIEPTWAVGCLALRLQSQIHACQPAEDWLANSLAVASGEQIHGSARGSLQ